MKGDGTAPFVSLEIAFYVKKRVFGFLPAHSVQDINLSIDTFANRYTACSSNYFSSIFSDPS